jgi:hypothetical protein
MFLLHNVIEFQNSLLLILGTEVVLCYLIFWTGFVIPRHLQSENETLISRIKQLGHLYACRQCNIFSISKFINMPKPSVISRYR